MDILAIIGSPRKGGNTDLLASRITEDKIYAGDYSIAPCNDCRACQTTGNCVIPDDMAGVYTRIEKADLIILATPMYWYGPSAQIKLLIDRLRPYITSGKLKGKKAAVIIASEEGPSACPPMVEMFKKSFEYLGLEYVGELLVLAYERGEFLNKPEEMKKLEKFKEKINKKK